MTLLNVNDLELGGLKMAEVEKIKLGDLDWKKGEDYRDKFSEVVSVTTGERSVILDFGTIEEDGKEGGEELSPKNLHISHHTRIRVSPGHFKGIVKMLADTGPYPTVCGPGAKE